MSRSAWKGFFIDNNIIKLAKKKMKFVQKTKNKKNNKQEPHRKIMSRSSTVIEPLVGQKVEIHNGKQFFKKTIHKEMVGHKFGEFAFTRQKYEYKKNKKKNK